MAHLRLFRAWRGPAAALAAAVALAAGSARAHDTEPPIPFEPVEFERLEGVGDIGSELGKIERARQRQAGIDLAVVVRGPGSVEREGASMPRLLDIDPGPLRATVEGHIGGLEVSAGMLADEQVVVEGVSNFVGGVRLATADDFGSREIRLRTRLQQSQEQSRVAVELGPRFERRLPGGFTFILDGTAEAQAVRSRESRLWAVPGGEEGLGSLGLSGRTGLMR